MRRTYRKNWWHWLKCDQCSANYGYLTPATRSTHIINLLLLLVRLSCKEKSLEIFKLPSLSHFIIKVKAYRVQTSLMQCYNSQKFAHV